MESKTSSGQILIEFVIGLFVIILTISILWDGNKNRKLHSELLKKIKTKQDYDLRKYRNY